MDKKIFVVACIIMLSFVHSVHAEAPIHTIDTRAETINQYFKKRSMPLEGYGEEMVTVADKYNLDWRLLPAIAVQESTGGKHMCKNNPYGYGSCKITFTSIDSATDKVGKTIGGFNENVKVYKNTDTRKKLYYYNGTVVPSYPNEVIKIMDNISMNDKPNITINIKETL